MGQVHVDCGWARSSMELKKFLIQWISLDVSGHCCEAADIKIGWKVKSGHALSHPIFSKLMDSTVEYVFVSLPGTCVITGRSQRSMFLLREWSFYPTCWGAVMMTFWVEGMFLFARCVRWMTMKTGLAAKDVDSFSMLVVWEWTLSRHCKILFFIVHDHTLKNTQIATYLGVFFSFFKVCDGVVAQLVQIYIRGKKNC